LKTAFPETGRSCRDEASGLFHQAHFLAALEGELARWDRRAARPLALALVEFEPAPDWAVFGPLAQAAFRPFDLAARLSDNLAGFLFPEAGLAWAERRLAEFLAELRRDARLGRLDIRTGLALAQPRADLSPGEMMALALRNLSGSPDWAARDFETDPVTIIIEDERRLLFEGFRALEDGRRP